MVGGVRCMAERGTCEGGACVAGGCCCKGACVTGRHAWWGHAWQGVCISGDMAIQLVIQMVSSLTRLPLSIQRKDTSVYSNSWRSSDFSY